MRTVQHPARRRLGLVGAVAAAAVAGGGLVALSGAASSAPTRSAATAAAAVATTERRDLDETQQVPGTLAYGDATQVVGRRRGTLTRLPNPGDVVTRGHALWRVDDVPVVLLYGSLPLYRTLSAAADPTGADVDLVARNLSALGFWHGATRGARWDRWFAAAVTAWQRAAGLPQTGVVHPGDVVVTAGAVRVDEVVGRLTGDAAGPVLSVTSRTRAITLKAPTALAQSLRTGQAVTVQLPSGDRVAARVARIGARAAGDGGDTTTAVALTALDPRALDRSVLGPVVAEVVTESRRDVVVVPVAALLALSGGGYALELPDHRLVAVRVGLVADGEAEVAGIAAGTRVLSA